MKKLPPYKIDGPACISFSGGRSSAYMLYKILEAHNGKLPRDTVVCFANTGKEVEGTLEFVRDCESNFGIDISWLELVVQSGGVHEKGRWKGRKRWLYNTKIVDFKTASRNGEPFRDLVMARRMPPNFMTRYCTSELKIKRQQEHMTNIGLKDAVHYIGIRGDEPRRAVKIHGNIDSKGFETYCPMWLDKTTKQDVLDFWDASNFDLELPFENAGNCDLCYQKGKGKRIQIAKDAPELVEWWADLEDDVSAVIGKQAWFVKGQRYRDLITSDKPTGPDDTIPCFCGD